MSPVPKVPSWGDAARLQQLASGLKKEHGTYGAMVQRNEPGRPSGQKAAAQNVAAPPDNVQDSRSVAQAEWVRQFWQNMAVRFPNDDLIAMYAANSERVASERMNAFYKKTPNFEF